MPIASGASVRVARRKKSEHTTSALDTNQDARLYSYELSAPFSAAHTTLSKSIAKKRQTHTQSSPKKSDLTPPFKPLMGASAFTLDTSIPNVSQQSTYKGPKAKVHTRHQPSASVLSAGERRRALLRPASALDGLHTQTHSHNLTQTAPGRTGPGAFGIKQATGLPPRPATALATTVHKHDPSASHEVSSSFDNKPDIPLRERLGITLDEEEPNLSEYEQTQSQLTPAELLANRELAEILDLLHYCLETKAAQATHAESPLATFASLKLLLFVDKHTGTPNSDLFSKLTDVQLYDILLGLKGICRQGVVLAAVCLVLVADVVEDQHRVSVILYHIMCMEDPEFLKSTNLFVFLAYLPACALRAKFLQFALTLVRRGVITHNYILDGVKEIDHRIWSTNKAPTTDMTQLAGIHSVQQLLNQHWLSKLPVELRAFFTPIRHIEKNEAASLHCAVYETEASYFECPELAYPPFLFSPEYPSPETSVLLQGHVFYDFQLPNRMPYQMYRVEIEFSCTHDAIDHTEDSLIHVFCQHYWPPGPIREHTNMDPTVPSQTPQLRIVRARHDVRSLLASKKGKHKVSVPEGSPSSNQLTDFADPLFAVDDDTFLDQSGATETSDVASRLNPMLPNTQDYLFLSQVGKEFWFKLNTRRKVILPFFLSERFPAFIFTVHINHNNRFCDVFDDLADPRDPDMYPPEGTEEKHGVTSTFSSRAKDNRFNKEFSINSKHWNKNKALDEANKTKPTETKDKINNLLHTLGMELGEDGASLTEESSVSADGDEEAGEHSQSQHSKPQSVYHGSTDPATERTLNRGHQSLVLLATKVFVRQTNKEYLMHHEEQEQQAAEELAKELEKEENNSSIGGTSTVGGGEEAVSAKLVQHTWSNREKNMYPSAEYPSYTYETTMPPLMARPNIANLIR